MGASLLRSCAWPDQAAQLSGQTAVRTQLRPRLRNKFFDTEFRSCEDRNVCLNAASGVAAESAPEYKTFTNPEGRVLTPITDDVWAAERPFMWNAIDVNGRMAVLKLQDGSIWVHSPVGLDENLKAALADLGPVKHVVSPNYEHVKYAEQWQKAYPDANMYACPGLGKKMPAVRFDMEFNSSDRAPPEWGGEVDCQCLFYERNPFNGKPFFNEVVFLHKPSRIIIVSDLYWNYDARASNLAIGTRAWKFGMDRIYLPFYRTFMIREKDEFRAAMRRIFDEWQFDGILPCHGNVVRSGGKSTLKRHLGL